MHDGDEGSTQPEQGGARAPIRPDVFFVGRVVPQAHGWDGFDDDFVRHGALDDKKLPQELGTYSLTQSNPLRAAVSAI